MRRSFRVALAAAGVLLVVAGALVKWVAGPALVKAPLDIHSTTVAEGPAKVLVVSEQQVKDVTVVATRVVTGDAEAGNGDVAVYDQTLCLVVKGTATDSSGCAKLTEPGFLQKTTDRVAFDRVSATAVRGDYRANVNGDAKVQHTGLSYTFPIGTGKKTYPLFDTIAGKAFPATFEGTATIGGLTVYRFVSHVPKTAITIQSVLPGSYTGTTTVWVEPTTGVIVKGEQQITQQFPDGKPVFDGTLTFTPATVQDQASFADDQLGKIHIVRWWLPLGLAVVGVALLAVAGLTGRRRAA